MMNKYFILLSILCSFFLLFSGTFGRTHKSKMSSPYLWIYNSRLFGGGIFLLYILIFIFTDYQLNEALKYLHQLGLVISIYMIFDGLEIISLKNIINHRIYYYIAKIEYYLGWLLLSITGIIFVYCKIQER
ncbi:MAG: hypothetical protein ACD_79C00048G0002 [uncultured bacterium]|nr:MAG: hypothetical protein ACD_79C00048G0002 [uncultured bacterium]